MSGPKPSPQDTLLTTWVNWVVLTLDPLMTQDKGPSPVLS